MNQSNFCYTFEIKGGREGRRDFRPTKGGIGARNVGGLEMEMSLSETQSIFVGDTEHMIVFILEVDDATIFPHSFPQWPKANLNHRYKYQAGCLFILFDPHA